MSGAHRLDPETEELLRTIAADPRSTLLRAPRPARPMSWSDCWVPVHANAAGLTAAERHLLLVHRAEAAALLRELFLLVATSLENLSTAVDADTDLRVRPRTRSLRALRRQIVVARKDLGDEERLALRSWLRRHVWRTRDLVDLAVATLNIQPNDATRVHLAFAYSQAGNHRSTLELSAYITAGPVSPAIHGAALEVAGVAHTARGQLVHAHDCYRRACRYGEPRVMASASWLCMALQVGDRASLEEACRLVNEWFPPDHPVLENFISTQRTLARRGVWKPTAEAMELLPKHPSSPNSSAQKILDLFAEPCERVGGGVSLPAGAGTQA